MKTSLIRLLRTSLFIVLVLQRKLGPVCLQSWANAESTQTANEQQQTNEQMHPSLLVDTKFWIKNTEFNERENWRHQERPCTLLERIQINEMAAVSLGDSLDSIEGATGPAGATLEANIRELTLPPNGILLLEEYSLPTGGDDSIAEPPTTSSSYSSYVDYLRDLGDCQESNWLAGEQKSFHFELESDEFSWFNPANWNSLLNIPMIVDWVPDSHLIPCQEDVVVFGNRHAALMPSLEGNERAELLTFKVNFRPSEFMSAELANNISLTNLRVSKLKIGEQAYNQQEFDRLIRSSAYENILFQFNDNRSALRSWEDQQQQQRSDDLDYYAPPTTTQLLTIDETSIQLDPSNDLCSDEAGCLCGNEDPKIMQLICSFNYPLEQSQLPCHDPIQTPGYCNRICATTMIIIMDPTVFSERFLSNTLRKMFEENSELLDYGENLFIGARRVDHNRYEVTFRLVPSASIDFEDLIGFEIEFAGLFRQKLENVATKSFYGIRSIDVKSSTAWRRNNRNQMFWLTMIVLFPLAILVCPSDTTGKTAAIQARLSGLLANISQQVESRSARVNSDNHFSETNDGAERLILDDIESIAGQSIDMSPSESALVELDDSCTPTTTTTNVDDDPPAAGESIRINDDFQ